MCVMIIDDSETNLMVMTAMVNKLGVERVVSLANPLVALLELEAVNPDLILVDYMMPQMDGVTFIRRVRENKRLSEKPIVMVTTVDLRDVRMAALDAGATDFISKPIEPSEFKARVRNLLALGKAQSELRETAVWLSKEIKKALATSASREEEIIFRLSRAAEFRDADTADHVSRMAAYSRMIAEALGESEQFCHDLYLAAPMHDVGKIGVPDAILLKNGPLTEAERAAMQQHVRYGGEILSASSSDLICLANEIARTHHERWDGAGYPNGFSGTQIPLAGRIVAVADVFDALTSARPYKQAWSVERAKDYLLEESGKHFDPACIEAFLSRWDDAISIAYGHKAKSFTTSGLAAA